jgi:CsoR family transcriptional regulator, copper-sensing transcriptional repressor
VHPIDDGSGPDTLTMAYPPRVYWSASEDRREPMYGYTMNKKALQDRLRRIEGQVRGLQRMVEEDQYCIDILTQVNSAASALKSVGMGLLDDHVRHCVKESIETGDSDEKVEELLAAVARFAGK